MGTFGRDNHRPPPKGMKQGGSDDWCEAFVGRRPAFIPGTKLRIIPSTTRYIPKTNKQKTVGRNWSTAELESEWWRTIWKQSPVPQTPPQNHPSKGESVYKTCRMWHNRSMPSVTTLSRRREWYPWCIFKCFLPDQFIFNCHHKVQFSFIWKCYLCGMSHFLIGLNKKDIIVPQGWCLMKNK